MGALSHLALRSRPKASSPTRRVRDINEGVHNAKKYSYEELKTTTDHFDLEKKIGEGSFGPVYKGRLNDGTLVAIKVLSTQSEQGEPEFLKEIEVLSGLDHVNLVKLYGCCTEGDHRILVYDYVRKNSLAQTLVGDPHNKREFSWEVRSRICKGLAEGFTFLHDHVKLCIVHSDIKPSNVLLDEDFTPKISDFGLAKIFLNSITHITTVIVAGTPGYFTPEYVFTGRVSSKADVYSFGVLLPEIVNGSRKEHYLPRKAWKMYKRGSLEELVDETLKGNENSIVEACKYLKIGLLCTQERPAKRPTMSDFAKMLEGEIDVDKMKIPMARKLMAQLASGSSSCVPPRPLLWSCFSGRC